ncbi:histone-lysine n-methyltransferase ashr1 [Anaeramoeba ignava]|uniref:Histone-lysine n-methyltransferase ashr1 n=1 Tax=Anaeramoeba ignava TaxID=1746090 RepID=A0A9Q0LVJ4_ANAIG|nr:histone-lysine n-methyltransferase ashr1 [Anaeramoeba ignava]
MQDSFFQKFSNIQLTEIENKGKGIIATKQIEAGNYLVKNHMHQFYIIILKQNIVHIVTKEKQKKNYFGVLDANTHIIVMKIVKKKIGVLHKFECNLLVESKQEINKFSETVLLVTRIMARRYLESHNIISQQESTFNDLLLTCSNRDLFSKERLENFGYMAMLLFRFLPKEIKMEHTDIIDIFCRLSVNGFTIVNIDLQPIGFGFYPKASFMNHSCNPNCVAVFSSNEIHIRTISNIETEEECSISYIELMNSTQMRKKQLLNDYLFDCKCKKCQDPQQKIIDSLLENDILNPDQKLQSEQLFLKHKNKINQTENEKELEKMFEDLEKALAIFNNNENAIRCKHSIKKIALINSLIDISVDLKKWTRAKELCSSSIETFELVYPEYFPTLGYRYSMLGKLSWYLFDDYFAVQTLRKSLKIVAVSHGIDHPLYKKINDLVIQTETFNLRNLSIK